MSPPVLLVADTTAAPRPAPAADGAAWVAWRALVQRELKLSLRRWSDAVASLAFLVIVVSLLPLGLGGEPALMQRVGGGVVWVAALLASTLTLGRLFADDHADGSLDQMLLAACPLPGLVLAKVCAHWLSTGLPVVLVSPLLALQFGLPGPAVLALMLTLALGTPVLGLVGAVGAALTVGLRGAGVLLALLVLPLHVPVLVFGAAAVDAATTGLGFGAHASLLGALLVSALFLAPWATAAALRISLE